jgi:hypothetical protein
MLWVPLPPLPTPGDLGPLYQKASKASFATMMVASPDRLDIRRVIDRAAASFSLLRWPSGRSSTSRCWTRNSVGDMQFRGALAERRRTGASDRDQQAGRAHSTTIRGARCSQPFCAR